jgi:hypothetical protein
MIWDISKMKELNDRAISETKVSYVKPDELHVEGDYDELAESYSSVVGAYDTLIEMCWDLYDSEKERSSVVFLMSLDKLLEHMRSLDSSCDD